MDEEFNHELVFEDTKNTLYKTIVIRREAYTAFFRLFASLVCFSSFVAALWLYVFTKDYVRYVPAMLVFFLFAKLNAQVLNYRAILQLKKDEGEVDDLDDLA